MVLFFVCYPPFFRNAELGGNGFGFIKKMKHIAIWLIRVVGSG